jgi:hypothetical protein
LIADADLVPDVAVFAQGISETLEHLGAAPSQPERP